MIQQELHALQHEFGYLPADQLRAMSKRLKVPLRRLHEVASCFPHYRLEPPPTVEFKVCRDMACHLRGAPEYIRALKAAASELGDTSISVEGVSCLGQCDAPPAVVVGHEVHRGKTIEECRRLLRDAARGDDSSLHTRFDVTIPPPARTGWQIDPYDGREAYEAARKFVEGDNADKLIAELEVSDLLGMGGAGVPAHQKWLDVRRAPGKRKFVIVNGDESEPGTFKDRELLLKTPHLVIEGVILGGMLTGAERGFIYIRHEYEPQIEAVRAAIVRAERLGVCGKNALGTGRDFPIEVYVSPGGYICGEQSALIEAMEDRRAEPRNKPPTIETNGYLDQPTLLSNVETFAWVPSIWHKGGDWYAKLGVNRCKGARFFSISGDLKRPGVYEIPNGTPLGDLINKYAGGMRDGLKLKAVAPSGPSGGFLPAKLPADMLPKAEREKLGGAATLDLMSVPLDLKAFRALGLSLGGGLVVYGDTADMMDQALNATEFYRNESCGKCVPCRIGCQKLVEIGGDIQGGRYDGRSLSPVEDMVGDLARAMELASICGLGAVAANPLSSTLRHFRDDLAPYVQTSDRPRETPR
jgi:formate dehydrogenase beta subunit